ncbi:hypothetical protein ABL78_1194 [Leptomonas seymouri]|uniref:Leucine-rich repeat protein n=1 Tax=Leptomonas seymouri TaxID=5684 RepID=A0A0N1IB03_LEPSE|nr:hypothetical protein ABL78_1194 [Leptomonas seymouri]|eukprot:KPI89701.1 hypothetical protein ABL78_1194 [Leptomonas seymouri]
MFLQNACSSASQEEPVECTAPSSASSSSVTHIPLSSIDSIIQSINKRYEVYQKRRTAITPFCTPSDAFLGATATPRPILGDSSMANAPSGGGNGNASKRTTSQPARDMLAESIVAAHAHPAPYWEERELYIVAEDLCCYLNGGINYRLLCEQYQRALEVMLRLVKDSVAVCASGAVEFLPSGTTKALGKLQTLMKESLTMLEEAGIDVPSRLSTILDLLSCASEESPLSERPYVSPSPPPSAATGAMNGNSASSANANGAPAADLHCSNARLPFPQAPTRRQTSANPVSMSNDTTTTGNGALLPPRVLSGGSNRYPVPPRKRSSTSTSDTSHTPVHFFIAGSAAPGGSGTGTRRNTPNSTAFVDPPEGGIPSLCTDKVNSTPEGSTGTHELRSSILRSSITGNTGAISSLVTPTPPSNAPTAPKPKHDDSVATCDSPIPGVPPHALDDHLADDSNHRQQPSSLEPPEVESSAVDQITSFHGRLRLLKELYGEHYALNGMALLTDALGVVFAHEYDQGPEQRCQDSFAIFQRDVNAKVMPALKSYDALQQCITELTPLRSAYLTSCLTRRVRPNDTVLNQLKNIDHDRTLEALQLGGLHLGDLGMAAVVESIVPRFYRLRTLNLSDNNLHDGVLELLLRSIRYHPALETIDFSRNHITDSGLPFLLRMVQTVPRLSSVILNCSGMTPAAKRVVETEMAVPGMYTVSTPLLRRATPSLSRTTRSSRLGSGHAVGAKVGISACASREPQPPMSYHVSSSMDRHSRHASQPTARAASLPVTVNTVAGTMMASKSSGLTKELKLPPLAHIATSYMTK